MDSVVITTYVILSSNKIQMETGDILVPANPGPPGKMAVKTKREMMLND